MALPLLVGTYDLEAWLGATFDVDDDARAEAVLSAVSALIRSETGLTWVTDDALDAVPGEVQAVVLQVATRVWNNPSGIKQESIGSYSVSYDTPWASGLYLSAQERALLGRYRTNARGLWSLSTTRDDPDADTTWVPVEGTTTKFPWYGDDVIA